MQVLISQEWILSYRYNNFCLDPSRRLSSQHEAVQFINKHHLVAFWPIKGIPIPSLWAAVAGDRPVADAHDDPGHVTWGWKDGLLGKGLCYYGRILCSRNFFASLELLPDLYALTSNYGDPSEDYLIDYEQGRMSLESRSIYEAILQNGPMDTISLKKAARLTSRTADSEFNKALNHLQMEMKIMPVGVASVGSWHYAFQYDIVARHFPEQIARAGLIQHGQARERLILTVLNASAAISVGELHRLFHWARPEVLSAVDHLCQTGCIQSSSPELSSTSTLLLNTNAGTLNMP
jgi:hypothetical protein